MEFDMRKPYRVVAINDAINSTCQLKQDEIIRIIAINSATVSFKRMLQPQTILTVNKSALVNIVKPIRTEEMIL